MGFPKGASIPFGRLRGLYPVGEMARLFEKLRDLLSWRVLVLFGRETVVDFLIGQGFDFV